MPKLLIKHDNVWKEVLRPLVKVDGSWRTVKKIFVKQNGEWKQTFGNTGSVVIDTPGMFTFTVPAGVETINVSYPTITGIQSVNQSVIPGQNVSGVIGPFGQSSSFNGLSAPIYTIQIFTFSGNVDIYDFFSLKIDTTVAKTFTSSGVQSVHRNNATLNGVILDEYSESNQGDFSSNITVRTVPTSTLVSRVRVVGSYTTGRNQVELIQQQPDVTNNYVAIWTPNDAPGKSNSPYSYSITLEQIVPFTISY